MPKARVLVMAALLALVFVLAARAFASEEGRRWAGAALIAGAVILVATDRISRR